jgi:hypothetical protein
MRNPAARPPFGWGEGVLTMRALVVSIMALAAVTFVACDRTDRSRLSHDAHAVANDIKAGVHKLGSNADVKKAGAEVKGTAAEAGHAVKSTAHEAANAVRHTGADAKHAVKKS